MKIAKFVLSSIIAINVLPVVQADEIDCPLRDASYSIDTPVMDIINNPEARQIVNEGLGGTLDRLPPSLAGGSPPSFSAIMNVRSIASMARLPDEKLEGIDKALGALDITDADRKARCARYDNEVPESVVMQGSPSVLVFGKINGFKDEPSFEAAGNMLRKLAESEKWSLVSTKRAGALTADYLKQFDVVIWNNVSGDVLTLSQREAFKNYIEEGGAYIGIHGAGGDPVYLWDWYVEELLGVQFSGHPKDPQFQNATIHFEKNETSINTGLPASWSVTDEWYSFKESPRDNGAFVIATLDENTYEGIGYGGESLDMGDHPVAWARCVGKGRAFYSALGHVPEIYNEPNHMTMIKNAVNWAARAGEESCPTSK